MDSNLPEVDTSGRRSGDDRRDESDRRRSAKGLFELRARRESLAGERRQRDRRDSSWAWLAFWRRGKEGSDALS